MGLSGGQGFKIQSVVSALREEVLELTTVFVPMGKFAPIEFQAKSATLNYLFGGYTKYMNVFQMS